MRTIALPLALLAACSSGHPVNIAAGSTSGDPPLCFVNADCPPTLADVCHSVHCDPTGKSTAPGSPVVGCYLIDDCIQCHATSDCPAVPCAISSCFDGGCLTAYADNGAPCDGGTCAAGVCQ